VNTSFFIAFIIFTLIFILLGKKVTAWTTIARLGFLSETPEMYLKHPLVYHYVPVLLFILALISIIFVKNTIVLISGILFLLIAASIVAVTGRSLGIKRYRDILQEMLVDDEEMDEGQRKNLQEQLAKKDAELMNEIKILEL